MVDNKNRDGIGFEGVVSMIIISFFVFAFAHFFTYPAKYYEISKETIKATALSIKAHKHSFELEMVNIDNPYEKFYISSRFYKITPTLHFITKTKMKKCRYEGSILFNPVCDEYISYSFEE